MATCRVSLKDLTEKFQLSKTQLDKEVRGEHLTSMSMLMDDHETVGNALGLNEAEMHAINSDKVKQEHRRLEVLRQWKRVCVFKATYEKLIEAFINCSRGDLATEVCKLLTKTYDNEEVPEVDKSAKSFSVSSSKSSFPEHRAEVDGMQSSPMPVKEKEHEPLREIKGTTSFLLEQPIMEADIVVERKALLGVMKVTDFAKKLQRVGSSIRIACYGAKAAEKKFPELHLNMQELFFDLAKLCRKSATTMSTFKRCCIDTLKILKATYDNLLENREDMALGSLEEVSCTAHKMVAVAKELHKDFEEEESRVQGWVKVTSGLSSQQDSSTKKYEEEYQDLKIKLANQQMAYKRAREAEERFEIVCRKYEMEKHKSIEEPQDQKRVAVRLMNAVTSLWGNQVFDEEEDIKEQEIKRCQKEVSSSRKEMSDMKAEDNQRCVEFSNRIDKCVKEGNMAKVVLEALCDTVYGLNVLAVIIMEIVLFWKQIEEHCLALEKHQLKKEVEKAKNRYDDPNKRIAVWTSEYFEQYKYEFSVRWLALRDVCEEYMKEIEKTKNDIDHYIMENPSCEEAARNVSKCAQDLKNELKKERKAFEKKN